jgi:hypothetical protein
MKTSRFKLPMLAAMLLGLPSLGITLTGGDISAYLEFPPVTHFIPKAPFSASVFTMLAIAILLTTVSLCFLCLHALMKAKPKPVIARFPWWGWLGGSVLAGFWIIAWNQFDWARMFQEHTFFPLWAGYIISINALTFHRTGSCMLTQRPWYFLALFPVSAGFWWFFEYLNRFVQNWHYTGTLYGPFQYFMLASLAFSTVLPAVLGTKEYLLSFSWLNTSFGFSIPVLIRQPKIAAGVILALSAVGLGLLGVYPDYLFPLLWVSPLIFIVSLKTLYGEKHLLHIATVENQRQLMAAMLAALICGFFWEMWNYFSLVKWHYQIPLVDCCHLFEMPVLGYSGYLPFGLECAVIGESVAAAMNDRL